MNKILLLTRPNHDLTTNYLFYWSSLVIQEAKKKKIKVLDLKGKKANIKTLQSYLKKHRPKLVFFNGHGANDLITGYNNKALIKKKDNEQLLFKKIIYARSCDSAKKLGPSCIIKGVITFIGYRRKFAIGYSHSKISRPLQDAVAKLFLEPSNLILTSLLKGNTTGNSYRKSQKTMLKNFHFMLSAKASLTQRDAAPYLWMNRKYQTLLGNKSAKF